LKRCASILGDVPKRAIKARAFDNVRFLLPAGTGTNVAVVINLRDVRDEISRLRGHSNTEFQSLGNGLYEAVSGISSVLVKRTEPDCFHLPVRSIGELPASFDPTDPSWNVEIHKPFLLPCEQLEQKAFESLVADFYGMSWTTFCKHMESRPNKIEIPDIFKTIKVSFDILMDYGAFRDLQRHRRCEQYVEPLTANYGYIVPTDIKGTDLESEYRDAMELLQLYDDERVIYDPNLMQYMVPLGYLHRSIFQMDLKELYYIAELRTQPQGHISYRKVAYKMFELAEERWPFLMQWCRVVDPEGSESIHL
jgi:thymidylate synthase ThyX